MIDPFSRLLVLFLGGFFSWVALASSASAPALAGDDEARDGWADLPDGFLPGPGRLRMELNGRPITLPIPRDPSWSNLGTYDVEAGGVRLSFRKRSPSQDGFSVLSALVLADESGEVFMAMEAMFPRLENALPSRFSPGGASDVFFLQIHGSGEDLARGFYNPETDQGIDFGLTAEAFSFSSRVEKAVDRTGGGATTLRGPGRRLRVEGRVPRGREVVLFAWKEKESIFFRAGHHMEARRQEAVESRAGFLAGLSLRGGPKLENRARKLLSQAPFLEGAYLEVGDGWQTKGKQKLLGEPSRSWLSPEKEVGSREDKEAKEDPPAGERGRTRRAPGGDQAATSTLESMKELSFRPGLWIVPHGQSEDWVFKKSEEAFVRDKNGHPVPGGFLGRYVVDGTSKDGAAYLMDLFQKLRSSGFSIFRLGGLGEALAFYKDERESLSDPGREPLKVLEDTLAAIRGGAGDDALLCGDWGSPLEITGLLDTAPPPSFQEDGVDPLEREGLASARGYFRHRRASWVECLPLTEWAVGGTAQDKKEWARSRVLFASLTGRGLLLGGSDPLPVWAQDSLRAAWPLAPVRPLDLFPSPGLPRVWDLKAGGSGAGGDLVGIFNWSALRSSSVSLSPRDLALPAREEDRYLWFDLLSESFAAASASPLDFLLLPGRSRLFSLHRDLGRPQVVGVSGSFLATATRIDDLSWGSLELRGRALFPPGTGRPGEDLRLHIACGPDYRVSNAALEGGQAQFHTAGSEAVLSLQSPSASSALFRIAFVRESEPQARGRQDLPPPGGLRVEFVDSERKPLLFWNAGSEGVEWWRSIAGFLVLRDGDAVGRTSSLSFLDQTASWGKSYRYSVAVVRSGKKGSEENADLACQSAPVSFTLPAAQNAFLDDWSLLEFSQKSGFPAKGRSVTGGPLSIGGRKFERGIGTRAPSRLDYRLDGGYRRFQARSGVDDAARFLGSVVFVVLVDGVERYRSPVVRGGVAEPGLISVPIPGAQVLSLVVEDAGDGAEHDLADWADAEVRAGED